MNQTYRSLTPLRNARLIKLEPISQRRRTVSHTDDPFTAAKSSTRLIFSFPLTLILSALTLSSFALLQLTTTCAVLTRDSYGNWCVWDVIWSTGNVVTLSNCSTSLRFYRSYLSFPRKNWNIRGEDLLRYLRLETDALLLLSAWDVVSFKVLSPCLGSKSA